MKKRDLERKLKELGWRFLREGGNHEVWTSADGTKSEAVPRHKEIPESLARKIIRAAEKGN